MVLAIAALLSRLGLRIVAAMQHLSGRAGRLEFKLCKYEAKGEYRLCSSAQLEHWQQAERTSSSSSGYIG